MLRFVLSNNNMQKLLALLLHHYLMFLFYDFSMFGLKDLSMSLKSQIHSTEFI